MYAFVCGIEICLELLWARLGLVQGFVGDSNGTGSPSRALVVHVGDDVLLAADVAVVRADAAAELHPAVPGIRHHHHLVTGAPRLKRVRLAIFGKFCSAKRKLRCNVYIYDVA